MKALLGRKQGMTQIFDENGKVHPATVLRIEPHVVTQVKTTEKDGYVAVQVGVGERKEKNVSKPVLGHLKELGPKKVLREFRMDKTDLERGAAIDVSAFEAGDKVKVSAISKGKGTQGTVKRYNFGGGPRSHGQKHTERAPGSIGAKGVARVFKGRKMPGRTGADRVTVSGLTILAVDKEAGTLTIKGAIPGPRGGLVEVRGR